MKIITTIADARNPKGWEEHFTAIKHDATYVDCRNQIERIVHRFNTDLLPGETPRELLCLRTEEIDEADAFNMGMAAFCKGQSLDEDNYWPKTHANHQHWRDGWEEARAMEEDGDDEKEGEGDE
jgi:hypothetical protein